MKRKTIIAMTIELSDEDLTVLQRQWGKKRKPSVAEITQWVCALPQTVISDYRSNQQQEE